MLPPKNKVRLLSAFAALIVLFGFASISAAAGSNSAPPVPVLSWVACGDLFPGAECAIARVPLDYDQPFGSTTEIALARIPASDRANKIGSLFINPGGPGASGVDFALFGFGDFLNLVLQGRFDIVGFDPRGIGASNPIRCFDTTDERAALFAGTPVFPYRRAQERPFFDVYQTFAHTCLDRNQRITDHMSTADVVRDLDLLREAVGDKRLNYLGFSYGSYLGNTYANLFPRKVRALVIDGVLDPRLWSSGLQILSDRVNTVKEFNEFLRLCDEAAAACGLNGPAGAAARYDGLAEAIRNRPLVLPDGFVYSYDILVADTAAAMYAPEVWFDFGAFLGLLADAVLASADPAQGAVSLRQAIENRLYPAALRRDDYNNGLDAYFGNQCADTEYPRHFAAYHAMGEFAAQGSIFGPYWWWSNAPCSIWPTARDRYAGPWMARTSAPVLVVGNFFDGVTSYEGALASSKLLQGSRLLSYAGWGHTAFGRSECVRAYVVSYLLDGSLPPKGTVCAANPNPFLSAALRSTGPVVPMIGLPPRPPLRSSPSSK